MVKPTMSIVNIKDIDIPSTNFLVKDKLNIVSKYIDFINPNMLLMTFKEDNMNKNINRVPIIFIKI